MNPGVLSDVNWKDIASLVLVGFLWGITNCLMRRGTTSNTEIEKEKNENKLVSPSKWWLVNSINNVVRAISNWRFTVPFIANQSGSLLYYWLLGSTDISLAVPACNSLAILFTALTEWIVGERTADCRTITGIGLIMIGVFIMNLKSMDVSVLEET